MAKQQTERLGIAFLMAFFGKQGWMFREESIHDYGIDAQVEICEGSYPSGKLIAIQSKSGLSYFKEENEKSFTYRPEQKHVKYWLQHYLPVIVVLHHPKDEKSYWQSVSEENIKGSRGGGRKIEIPKINDFSDAKKCLTELQSLFKQQIIRIVKQAINKCAGENNSEIIQSLTNAVTNLAQGKTHATESERDAAFAALRKGDLSLALSLFENEAECFEKEAKKGAEVQRNIGALAFFSDTEKSLRAYRRATQLDPDNADGWNQLGNISELKGNPKSAIAAYENVLKIGENNKNQKEVATAYNGLGNIYKYSEKNKAVECYEKVLSIGEDFEIQEAIATACENIAVIHCQDGNFDEAIELYQRALKINEEINDREGMASNYLNLGTMYYDREANNGSLNFKDATKYLNDSLSISESLNDREKVALIYGTLGNIRKASNDYDGAIDFYNKSLKINEILGRKKGMAVQYENLGALWMNKDLDKAFNYYSDALGINKSIEVKDGVALDYANMGLVRKKQAKYLEAREYLEKSIILYQSLGSPHKKTVQAWLNELQNE